MENLNVSERRACRVIGRSKDKNHSTNMSKGSFVLNLVENGAMAIQA
jgi:hypothetical protein